MLKARRSLISLNFAWNVSRFWFGSTTFQFIVSSLLHMSVSHILEKFLRLTIDPSSTFSFDICHYLHWFPRQLRERISSNFSIWTFTLITRKHLPWFVWLDMCLLMLLYSDFMFETEVNIFSIELLELKVIFMHSRRVKTTLIYLNYYSIILWYGYQCMCLFEFV